MNEYGQEPHSAYPNPLESLIEKDERERYRNSIKKKLTTRQWQVYELYHFKQFFPSLIFIIHKIPSL